jgi:putative addiction module CopG family antidote
VTVAGYNLARIEGAMNVSLNSEVERFVAEKVRAGQYRSADEAVNGLLAKLKEQERVNGDEVLRRGAEFPVFHVPPAARPFTSEDVRRGEDEP